MTFRRTFFGKKINLRVGVGNTVISQSVRSTDTGPLCWIHSQQFIHTATMVDSNPQMEPAQCPSYAAGLGYLGVAAAVCLSNWGSAVSSDHDTEFATEDVSVLVLSMKRWNDETQSCSLGDVNDMIRVTFFRFTLHRCLCCKILVQLDLVFPVTHEKGIYSFFSSPYFVFVALD